MEKDDNNITASSKRKENKMSHQNDKKYYINITTI